MNAVTHQIDVLNSKTGKGYGICRAPSLFDDLTEIERQALFAHEHVSLYHRGQPIFYEGTRPTGLYFVLNGKVKVYKKGLWDHEQIIRLAKSGDLLSLRAVGGTSEYAVSASALEDSEILFIELEDFDKVLKCNPTFAYKVISLLARELDQAENRIRDFAQKNVRQRLADLLLFLQSTYGENPGDGHLAIRMTREELANYIGTASETVVRLLAEFRQKKLIVIEGRNLRIINRERLERAANPDRIANSGQFDKNQVAS